MLSPLITLVFKCFPSVMESPFSIAVVYVTGRPCTLSVPVVLLRLTALVTLVRHAVIAHGILPSFADVNGGCRDHDVNRVTEYPVDAAHPVMMWCDVICWSP